MIKDRTGSDIAPMLFLSACLAFGGLMTFVMQAVIRASERHNGLTEIKRYRD
jgi:hypothetical protein